MSHDASRNNCRILLSNVSSYNNNFYRIKIFIYVFIDLLHGHVKWFVIRHVIKNGKLQRWAKIFEETRDGDIQKLRIFKS